MIRDKRLSDKRRAEEEAMAQRYAEAIYRMDRNTDWSTWNHEIVSRWSGAALRRIKRRAWSIVEFGK